MTYTYGNLKLIPSSQTLYKDNRAISLSATETKIVLAFMKRPNQTIAKIRLFEEVWGHSKYDENMINVYMTFLRKKIEDDPRSPRYIQTVWGVGYLLAGNPL